MLLLLFFNYVIIIIKATTIWVRIAVFPPTNA